MPGAGSGSRGKAILITRTTRAAITLALLGSIAAPPALAQDHDEHAVSPDLPTDAAENEAVFEVRKHDGAAHGGDAGAHDDTVVPPTPTLLEGYGNGGFAITTKVPEAQAFFSNGMELAAAFAHPAAIAAMKEAVRLDPECAMCEWGLAYADGPTLNYGKSKDERAALYEHAKRARMLAKSAATPREKALIDTLVTRYRKGDIDKRERAYADALDEVLKAYPEDKAIAVLAADARMMTSFSDDGPDMDRLAGVISLLEGVIARSPDSTPAIHYYIHATEVALQPARAEMVADRLEGLAPRASHLVHMPSHIYYWVGRYQDAADANRRAVEIGKEQARMLDAEDQQGVWGLPYHSHNVIFGIGGAMMAGDSRTALDLARPLVERSQSREEVHPILQLLSAAGYFAIARFDPASVADLPKPKAPYLVVAWHYARGEAAAWSGDVAAVRTELKAIPEKIVGNEPEKKDAKESGFSSPAPDQMLGIVRGVLEGRIAMLEGRPQEAAAAFTRAAEIEETKDFQRFSDPPAFWYPVRRDVGRALLAAGDAQGALAASEASLKIRPQDPVALALSAKAREAMATGTR